MKTVSELVRDGVTKIRREPWEPYSYLEVDVLFKGKPFIGPWCRVYGAVDYFEGADPETVLLLGEPISDPVWEPWVDPKEGQLDVNKRGNEEEQVVEKIR